VDVELSEHDVVRPDVAGWRRERLPNPGTLRPIRTVPDWVSEVTSPTSGSRDRVTKRQLYATHGVPYYWIVDPEARTLEALELKDGRWTELGAWDDRALAAVRPFEQMSLEVGRLFLPKEE
jgi:Uma2 family endonuclease